MEEIRLWLGNAPLALGETVEDIPAITPYLAEGRSDGKPTGAVIVCPGGGYGTRAGHEGEPIAEWLRGAGITAFVLRYRVQPNRHPAPLLDVQRAIRTVRSRAPEWNVDPDKIAVLGFSAGGHLTASAATKHDEGDPGAADPIDRASSRPNHVVLCYPVISFDRFGHEGSRDNLLGEAASDANKVSEHSLDEKVAADTPRAFLWHTSDDRVKVENSLAFATALARHGIPFDLHVYDEGVHGLGLAEGEERIRTWTSLCESWLSKYGYKGEAGQ
ncbi:alpha/beta hydrolase [Cohnella sp. GCM10027633]|uniref:alpha/beta hydrolase n=1 Tax=unclassified Cohnella TaxID=2636738 RepID=UPI0036342E45